MKKTMKVVGKIILGISIILILIMIILFIMGLLNSYTNGEQKTFLFGGTIFGPNDTIYGKDAIKLYLSKSLFDFCILTGYGILPIICIPIFVEILLKFKQLFSKNVTKYLILLIGGCIIINIICYLDFYSNTIFIFVPYIESVIVSYFIAKKIYKVNNKNFNDKK